jgi:hypothetical protein
MRHLRSGADVLALKMGRDAIQHGADLETIRRALCRCPDGEPWPPSDGNALWVIVRRRADGCTLWRAIQLAQVRSAATDFCNSPIGSKRN